MSEDMERELSPFPLLPLYVAHPTINFKPNKAWPPNRVPTDIFFIITEYLTKTDLAQLRLVNREFAQKLEYCFFREVLAPFAPDFYVADTDGEEDVGIFERVGSIISKFGIALDVDEVSLFSPPIFQDPICPKLFGWDEHGRLDPDRVIHQKLRDTELLAFRRHRLTKAFSHLSRITELALSLNTGMGWLYPPELCRFRPVFRGPPVVFRKRHWHLSANQYLGYNDIVRSGTRVPPDSYMWTELGEKEVNTWYGSDGSQACDTCRDQSQMELLSETSWAIQKFLSAFFPAVISNTQAFKHVHTLTFSSISSSLLKDFKRSDFFVSLTGLRTLSILVLPDWRKFDPTLTNLAHVLPSDSCLEFALFLEAQIVWLPKLESLTLGYIGGGEYAQGALVRNRNILPAPIMLSPRDAVIRKGPNGILTFKHIKSLTFENCWFAPRALIQFLQKSKRSALESLTFDSCSLVAYPGFKRRAQTRFCHETVAARNRYNRRMPPGIWATIIAQFGPRVPFGERDFLLNHVEFLDLKPPQRKPLDHLRRLEFVSCGYALLGPFYNQNNLVMDVYSNDERRDAVDNQARVVRDVDLTQVPAYGPFSQRVYTGDLLLGSIIQSIDEREEFTLVTGFGFRFGWSGSDRLRQLVEADGWRPGGTGRFSGEVIRRDGENS
ncbi:hypothetical protein PRK78_000178 [Emydomyces testavorans]|uniref:F-box domain-containing protein n=1 Tax=Emydomyces testavorans TaxID=2070801 RepID=A0AAF0DAN0_9EURO|nr:hypothetical protein PRK78_000178 [Emydomyces testavorans]